MPKTPHFRKEHTLADTVNALRRPPLIPETGWHGVTELELGPGFENGFHNVSGYAAAAWYLSKNGEARLRGRVTAGVTEVIDVTMFTLPQEVRPEEIATFVVPFTDNGELDLDAIRFRSFELGDA